MTEPGGRAGDAAGPTGLDASARDRLIETHLGLAAYLARRYSDRGEPPEDLRQVASLALVKAARRFDPSVGVEFLTFATRTIVGELKHHFRDHAWAVRAPREVQEHYLEVSAAVGELSQRLGRSPTLREVATACSLREDEVLVAMEAGQGYRTASLDAPESASDAVLDRLADEGDAEKLEQRAELAMHLRGLPDREREIVRLRFIEELSQSQIAARVGISQMHVSRLLRRALEQLRQAYEADA